MNTALTLLAALAVAATQAQAPARLLEVHFIDVGQGDAMLIRSPAGKTILVDAGNIGAGVAVNDYLDGLGVEGLDLVIVSHPHLDHMGGMKEVLEKHRPRAYVDPGYDHPIENYDELLGWLEANDVPSMIGRAGRVITVEEGITLELYSPEVPMLEGTRSDVNSNSIVMKLVYGTTSFLFTGDSEDETEQRVMTRADNLVSTVLKVAHHGGKHSTSEGWLAKVQPRYAVISCGSRNRYGHPTQEVLGRLGARGVEVYRTDRHGDVIARSDGTTITWETTGDRSARIDEQGGVPSFSRGRREGDGHRPKPALVDVNTADEAKLSALPGMSPERARALVEDRTRRGPFAALASLLRIEGFTREQLAGLEGHAVASRVAVDASPSKTEVVQATAPTDTTGKAPRPVARPGAAFRTTTRTTEALAAREEDLSGRLFAKKRDAPINLNLAEAEALARATGLEEEVARRVVADRQKRGPFRSADDLKRVEGLTAEARQKIVAGSRLRLDLNTATRRELVALGLDDEQARAVVEYRQEYGSFTSIDDLEDVQALRPQARHRVVPLLTVGNPIR